MDRAEALQPPAGSDEDDAGEHAAHSGEGGSTLTAVYTPAEQHSRLRRQEWRHLATLHSERFNCHMSQCGYAARLLVNFRDGELHFDVESHAGMARAGSSGGSAAAIGAVAVPGSRVDEYASICFLLTLLESSDCRFCALDAWDVASDPLARTVILDKLVSYSELHWHKQFILVTPRSITLAPTAAVAIHTLP